jgi:hypothetical protein
MPCKNSGHLQLDLLGFDAVADVVAAAVAAPTTPINSAAGRPLMLPLTRLFADPQNPRTEVPEAELNELAEDIRQHGILQPIVVHPGDADGRNQKITLAPNAGVPRNASACKKCPWSCAMRQQMPMPKWPRTKSATA